MPARKLSRANPAAQALLSMGVAQDAGVDRRFGLSADFPQLVELALDQVHPNPDQPRRHFDADALRDLAESIGRQGLLQPILVRRRPGGGYLIAAGERRWRAHHLAGRATIFAIVTGGDPDEVALVENLQRQELDPLETADALARLAARHGYSQDQLAGIVRLSLSEVSRLLQLTRLPDTIRDEYPTVRAGVSKSALFILADAPDDATRLAL